MSTDLIITFLLITLVLVVGISRMRKSTQENLARDDKALAEWEQACRLGLWAFALRGPIPLVFTAWMLATLITRWRESGSLAMSPMILLTAALASVVIGFIAAKFKWGMLESAANEIWARRRVRERQGRCVRKLP
jgi:ABC-type Fe3+ transport system permease subunit